MKFDYVKTGAVVGLGVVSTSAFANSGGLDMSAATTQLGYALVAVSALGAAKLVPAAISWVWSLLSRVAQR